MEGLKSPLRLGSHRLQTPVLTLTQSSQEEDVCLNHLSSPWVIHLLTALIQLLAALHIHGGAVGVGQVGLRCSTEAVRRAIPTVLSGNNGTSSGWQLAVHYHLHAAFGGGQVPLGFHNDAMALVSTVPLAHVFVEEQTAISDPSQEDTDWEVEQRDQGFPDLKQNTQRMITSIDRSIYLIVIAEIPVLHRATQRCKGHTTIHKFRSTNLPMSRFLDHGSFI